MSQRLNSQAEAIIVTGAGQGIGFATAQLLHEKTDAHIVCLDRTQKKGLGESVAQFLASDRTSYYQCELREYEKVSQIVKEIAANSVGIAGLAHCAGVLQMGELTELSPKQFEETFAINTGAMWWITSRVGNEMKKRKKGSIVAVTSNAGTTPRIAMGAYCASKAAATMIIKTLGLELAKYGVRCNSVSPGSTLTPMQEAMWKTGSTEEGVITGDLDNFRIGIPIGKLAKPSDIAGTIEFLLSPAANHITMHDLRVDGGATLDS